MNGKTRKFKIIFLVTSLLVVGLIALNGCKKSEPASPAEPNETAEPASPAEPNETAEPNEAATATE
jgi:hypothetical protein